MRAWLIPVLILGACGGAPAPASTGPGPAEPGPAPAPAPTPEHAGPALLEPGASWTNGEGCSAEPAVEWKLDRAARTAAAAGKTFHLPDGWSAELETPRVLVLLAPQLEARVRDSMELAIARVCASINMPSVAERLARRAVVEALPELRAGPINLFETGGVGSMGAPWSSVTLESRVGGLDLWVITTQLVTSDDRSFQLTAAAACARAGKLEGRCEETYLAMLRSGAGDPLGRAAP